MAANVFLRDDRQRQSWECGEDDDDEVEEDELSVRRVKRQTCRKRK